MLPKSTHVFSRQFNDHEKELIFDYVKGAILESTRAIFITNTSTLECKIPFFVSRWNPYGIFDAIRCTFENTESGNMRICYQTFHTWSVMTKIGVGVFFGSILFYVVEPEDIFWKISLYGLMVILYIGGLLWKAQRRNKKLFRKIIEYSESL